MLRADSVDRTRGHTMMSVKKAYLEQLSLSDFFKSLGQLIDEAYFWIGYKQREWTNAFFIFHTHVHKIT